MSDLEQTQAIYLEDFGDETDEENEDGKKKIVRIFHTKLFILYFNNITYFMCWLKRQILKE